MDRAERPPADPDRTRGEGADLMTVVVDSLPIGLIYLEHGGAGVAANRFARNLLGLPSADLTRDDASRRLARLGLAPEATGTGGQAPARSAEIHIGARRYATLSLPVEGAWGRGTVLRIEDVTEAHTVDATVNEARRPIPVSQVPGGVGHEFNNLLSRVICIAEDIQAEADVQVIREFAETLIVTAERGAELVRRYMDDAGGPAADARATDQTRE